MSYTGTVHCSYCGKRGHNRLGCPERRKIALANPDTHLGRQWHREQKRRKAQIENRKCSYCRQSGHNRRGCDLLKEDIRLIKNRQKSYIESFSDLSSSVGFGPGSLVKIPAGREYINGELDAWSQGVVAMVTDLDWGNLDFLLKDAKSHGWSRRVAVAKGRVVSTFGFPDPQPDDYWRNKPPKFNDKITLDTAHLSGIVEGVFREVTHGDDLAYAAKLVAPTKGIFRHPSSAQTLTQGLLDRFRLKPSSRADDFEKQRRWLNDDAWSKVRPEEYEKAKRETNSQ